MLWLSALALAPAQELAPRLEIGSTRAVKIDLFSFGQALHPYGTNWTPSALEQWSVGLHCEVTHPRTEACRVVGDFLWYSIVKHGEKTVVDKKIPFDGTIEFVWSPRGTLKSYDVRGERETFWQSACNAHLVLYHRDGVVFRDNAWREMGQRLELSLVRGLATALELDLPRKGELRPSWGSTTPLWAGRRWSDDAIGSGRYSYTASKQEDGLIAVRWSGRSGEKLASWDYTVQTDVLGKALWDPELGRAVELWTEAASTSTQPLVGHTRWTAVMRPFFSEAELIPGEFPEPVVNVE